MLLEQCTLARHAPRNRGSRSGIGGSGCGGMCSCSCSSCSSCSSCWSCLENFGANLRGWWMQSALRNIITSFWPVCKEKSDDDLGALEEAIGGAPVAMPAYHTSTTTTRRCEPRMTQMMENPALSSLQSQSQSPLQPLPDNASSTSPALTYPPTPTPSTVTQRLSPPRTPLTNADDVDGAVYVCAAQSPNDDWIHLLH